MIFAFTEAIAQQLNIVRPDGLYGDLRRFSTRCSYIPSYRRTHHSYALPTSLIAARCPRRPTHVLNIALRTHVALHLADSPAVRAACYRVIYYSNTRLSPHCR